MSEGEHKGKAHKPAKNHPWRQVLTAEAARWAKEKSDQTKANNLRVGRLDKKR